MIFLCDHACGEAVLPRYSISHNSKLCISCYDLPTVPHIYFSVGSRERDTDNREERAWKIRADLSSLCCLLGHARYLAMGAGMRGERYLRWTRPITHSSHLSFPPSRVRRVENKRFQHPTEFSSAVAGLQVGRRCGSLQATAHDESGVPGGYGSPEKRLLARLARMDACAGVASTVCGTGGWQYVLP